MKPSDSWRDRDDLGRFKTQEFSFSSLQLFILNRVNDTGNCWEWTTSLHRDGYGKVSKKPFWSAHRLSFFAFNYHIDEKLLVLHRCHNRRCVNPAHLHQGTYTDNARDTVNANRHKNTFQAGERHPNNKLHEGLVKHIRNLFKVKSVKEIAKELNLPRTTVSAICHRHSWRHLK